VVRDCDAAARYRILGAQEVSIVLTIDLLCQCPSSLASLAGGHIETRLVKRAAFGVDGQGYGVYMNAFEVSVPPTNIYHYDG